MNLADLESRLRADIPLAEAMGVRIQSVSENETHLTAPLAPNTNHKSTAFGGSVHSLAVLACWTLVSSRLSDRPVGYIVIQDSSIDYRKPVTGDFEAVAKWSSAEEVATFLKALDRKGLARVHLRAEVICRGEICAVLEGTFVAQFDRP